MLKEIKTGVEMQERISQLEDANQILKSEIAEQRWAVTSLKKTNSNMEINLKKRNSELKAAYDALKELDIQKEIFISIIIHELQTPLTSIKGFSQLLYDQGVDKIGVNTPHYLEIINQNAEKLYNIIMDLIDSTKINLGKIKMFSTNVDIYSIFKEIKQTMGVKIKDKKITPLFKIEKGIPKMRADKGRTIYILKNLLMNALQATEPGGTIELNIYRNGKFVQFEVIDHGIGISEENQKYIFNKFYQVKSPITRRFNGQGLGLSICKGLLALMDGAIWFESSLGVGSKFCFTLPIWANLKNPMTKITK